MPISPRKAQETFFAFIFQLSGWALVAPSCFALQVRGLQVPGPPCASFLLRFRSRNVIRMYTYLGILDRGLGSQAVRFQPGIAM